MHPVKICDVLVTVGVTVVVGVGLGINPVVGVTVGVTVVVGVGVGVATGQFEHTVVAVAVSFPLTTETCLYTGPYDMK